MEKDEAGTAGVKVMGHDLQKEGCLFKVVMVQNQGLRRKKKQGVSHEVSGITLRFPKLTAKMWWEG